MRRSSVSTSRSTVRRAAKKKICLAADLFCGAGGTSSGLLAACEANNIELHLIAINHWNVAIDTHTANHPYAKHLCESMDNVDPRKLVPGGRLNVLVAGPECTHHSNARGGRPMNDQSRASAWHILRWAEAIYIDNILVENVKEFRSWGPLGANGRPIKKLKGQLFLNFIAALKALGYRVEDRILNAADYGDPTTRERLFIIARRGNRSISWPAPTHAPASRKASTLFENQLKPWRTAREIIDWKLPGRSIFGRKKPLADKTLDRIAAGLRKFGGPNAEPFLILLRGTAGARSIDKPIPALTAGGTHVAVVEPFILHLNSEGDGPRGVDSDPMQTVTATSADFGLVEPFMLNIDHQSSGDSVRSVDQPVPTVTTKARTCIVEPFIIPQFSEHEPRSVDRPLGTVTTTSRGVGLCEPEAFLIEVAHGNGKEKNPNNRRVQDLDEPMKTVTTSNNQALVEATLEPFIVEVAHGKTNGKDGGRAQSVDQPLKTVTTKRGKALVTPYLLGQQSGGVPRSVDSPVPTVCGGGAIALVEPFVVKYYGTANVPRSVDEPLDTVTTKERFALVETKHGTYRLDIRFRMLEPHELAAAQGLAGYKFTGKKTEIVKQIGNAVPKGTAMALCAELI